MLTFMMFLATGPQDNRHGVLLREQTHARHDGCARGRWRSLMKSLFWWSPWPPERLHVVPMAAARRLGHAMATSSITAGTTPARRSSDLCYSPADSTKKNSCKNSLLSCFSKIRFAVIGLMAKNGFGRKVVRNGFLKGHFPPCWRGAAA